MLSTRDLKSLPRRWLALLVMASVVTLVGCAGSDPRNEPAELTQYAPTVSLGVGWRVPVGSGSSYGFAPAIVGDSVFAASLDGKVARIDANQGATVWNRQVAPSLSAGVGSDGQTVAVVTPKGEVIALDANGDEKWRAQATSEVNVVPWVGEGVVVVRSGDYRVQAFNAANGDRIWSVQRPGPALALRAPARMSQLQGLVLAGMPGGRLLAIEPGSGAVVWEGIVAVPSGASDLERVNDVVGIPVVRGDLLCAAAYQGRVTCFNAKEGGRTVWANNLSSIVGIGADSLRVYAPDSRDRVHAYKLEDGETVWLQDALRNRRLTEPGVVGSWVAMGDFDGYVHALSTQTGELAGRVSVGGGAMFAPVQTTSGGALVQAGDSSVVFIRLN
ncbi:MAG: outer membrane protein assembly factor BamB [Burkholderiaceae bacterium]|nr:outer membrane protein assembly factor BamB [Burkholderiaceae bacterium]